TGDQPVQIDLGDQGGQAIRVATPFVDIPGDPMILRFEVAGDARAQELPGPPTLDAIRFGPVRPGRLVMVQDEMVVKERALMTALPSSREDFAFFQATQNQTFQPEALPETGAAPAPDLDVPAPGEEVVVTDGDASWGESLGGEPVTVSYTDTAIQNTTSIAYVKAETGRQAVFKDIVLRVEATRSVADVLSSNGFSTEQAAAFMTAAEPHLPLLTAMPAGHIIAIRYKPDTANPEVLNLSLYSLEGYIGSLSRLAPGQYGQGADAWLDDDLPKLASSQGAAEPLAVQDFRLLDGFYSAAIRNGVPTNLVGEAIVLMFKTFDMESIAAEGDRMTLLYAPEPADSGGGPGQILFAGIVGPSGEKACYVTANAAEGGAYACFRSDGGGGGGGGGGGALGGGFVTPVQGTLTSKYGPRFHPILKVTKLHAGVDWAAPTGTPIVAVGAGTISFLGVAGGYGNVIYIEHGNGIQSRYAHMNAFGPGMANGTAVNKGDLIGYVGTTGRSTGPHLHFEIHVAGSPVDPLNFSAPGGGSTAPVAVSGVASAAVETLTDVIIQVESGGNASARNPLSSATGLGQFIESTWLRMMRDYRPDLAANMSRQELLDLRLDPTLSREMVMNLARENESFLRGKGHQITAGRLYLAHFLGPSGADVALSAQDGQTVLAVMGQSVVGANPFLTNYTIADLKAWADRKMGSAPAAPSAPVAAPIPPEVQVYMDVVNQIMKEARGESDAAETETGQPTEGASPPNP
ncbi:MAG: peptidoglycan DD-metalloendopeptidase family protein, partial [Paracoccaceae bacterium]